jgi:transmembrane sensor
MERKARPKLNTQIYEEACDWFVEFRGGAPDANARREFDVWVRKSPQHLAAYLEIAAIWTEGPSLDPEQIWPAETLIARAADESDNVVLLERPSVAHSTPRAGKSRFLAVAAALTVVSLAAGVLGWMQFFRVSTYTTAIGEQRSIVLADGSIVELNSRSRIQIRFSEQQRSVNLLDGQALFQVAKDRARPFVVASDGITVRAVGTQFDVYKKPSGTVVTVVEGRVNIRSGQANTVYLCAGEQLIVTPISEQKTAHPNVASATAWTQRQLIFESASLSDVAQEFNRYNERQLVIEDLNLHDFHISGVFSSTDPASLIRFLRQRPDVQVVETAAEIRIVKK